MYAAKKINEKSFIYGLVEIYTDISLAKQHKIMVLRIYASSCLCSIGTKVCRNLVN
jgi:hypothetical protein